jgi:hypothetical protein
LLVAALAACAPVMPSSDAGDGSAPSDAAASDAASPPFVGTWERRGTWSGSSVGGAAITGETAARVTFLSDGRIESEYTLAVSGCVVHREQSLARWEWFGSDVIRVSSRVCTPTDNTMCPVLPATNSMNSGSFLHDSSWIVVGSYTVMFMLGDGAALRFDRDAPAVWTRAQ